MTIINFIGGIVMWIIRAYEFFIISIVSIIGLYIILKILHTTVFKKKANKV
jgi:hypothetical protein